MKKDIVIIGGGAAGLAAALGAYDPSLDMLIIERGAMLGGILGQCIHHGFGLEVYKEELTGPEFANKLIQECHEKKIPYVLDTTVIDIEKKASFIILLSSIKDGLYYIEAKKVILTTGCYERTRGAIDIPGDRPKGIMPAGSAQRYLNMEGYLVGKNIFILGSGDIGLIMARRMTLEGAKVHGVAEIMPYSNGLTRNIVQCLDDYQIPLYLSHTVTKIEGRESLERITINEVDQNYQPIIGTEKTFEVDTLLLSIGLIPDVKLFNHLKFDKHPITKSAIVNQHYESSIKGLYVCGNALHVHDLVDWVVIESKHCGSQAKMNLIHNQNDTLHKIDVIPKDHIRYVIPQLISFDDYSETIELKFRSTKKITEGTLEIIQHDRVIYSKKMKHVVPAEMKHVHLPFHMIQKDAPILVSMKEVCS